MHPRTPEWSASWARCTTSLYHFEKSSDCGVRRSGLAGLWFWLTSVSLWGSAVLRAAASKPAGRAVYGGRFRRATRQRPAARHLPRRPGHPAASRSGPGILPGRRVPDPASGSSARAQPRRIAPVPASASSTAAASSFRMQSKWPFGQRSRPCSVQGWQRSFRHSTTCPSPAGAKPSTGDVLPKSATTRVPARRGQVHQAAVLRHRGRAAREQRRHARQRLACTSATCGSPSPQRGRAPAARGAPPRARGRAAARPAPAAPGAAPASAPRASASSRAARPGRAPPAARVPAQPPSHSCAQASAAASTATRGASAAREPERPQRAGVALERVRQRAGPRPARPHPAHPAPAGTRPRAAPAPAGGR